MMFATRVLLVCCLFLLTDAVNASDTPAGHEGTSSYAERQHQQIERKGRVPGRTLEHRARLDALGWEIFEPKIPSFEYHYFRVKSQELFNRFGEPVIRSSRKVPHRDPHPDYPPYFQVIAWQFSGMLLEVGAYPPSEIPELVWLRRVEISSPKYALKHGLRIGQPVSSFISLLGNPNRQNDQKMEYLIEDWIELENGTHIETYQIRLFSDDKDNVKTMLFTWESAIH